MDSLINYYGAFFLYIIIYRALSTNALGHKKGWQEKTIVFSCHHDAKVSLSFLPANFLTVFLSTRLFPYHLHTLSCTKRPLS